MAAFAVIDTETTWTDQVMSIGIIIADDTDFEPIEVKYYILPEECLIGGMYEGTLYLDTPVKPLHMSRREALKNLIQLLNRHQVRDLFAYNASFDRNHLPELGDFAWHDIMRFAAYRQHNPKIPAHWEFCSTGRLKRGYGVETMLQLLSGDRNYRETHNACFDALDELKIMELLGYKPEEYPLLASCRKVGSHV